MRKHLIIVAVVLLAVFVAAGLKFGPQILYPGGTPKDDRAYLQQIIDITQEWDDANQLASSTARISLSGPISQLQSIRRKAVALTPPEKYELAHSYMLKYMQKTIDGYMSFMSGDEDAAQADLKEASKYFGWFDSAIKNAR